MKPAAKHLDRLIRAQQSGEPQTPAPAEIRKTLPVLDQPGLRAPQLLPRVGAAIEEELAAYRHEKAMERKQQ